MVPKFMDLKDLPEIKNFKNKTEKKPFIIKRKQIADGWAVAMSKLYHQMNKKVKVLKKGEEFESAEIPSCYFEYKGKKYAIYDNDAGQCVYIYIDGEVYSGSSFCPPDIAVEEFCYIIEAREEENKKPGIKEIKYLNVILGESVCNKCTKKCDDCKIKSAIDKIKEELLKE